MDAYIEGLRAQSEVMEALLGDGVLCARAYVGARGEGGDVPLVFEYETEEDGLQQRHKAIFRLGPRVLLEVRDVQGPQISGEYVRNRLLRGLVAQLVTEGLTVRLGRGVGQKGKDG
jgi:hypothetical protein